MANQFDFIGPNDKPALLAISTPEWLSMSEAVLVELGYKVHKVNSHLEFPSRFSQITYQVVVIEDKFGAEQVSDNLTLQLIQTMPVQQRRHATIILLGEHYETLNALQAFQNSVHAVVNYSEIALLGQLVQKVVSENELFLRSFKEIQVRVAQAKD